MIKLKKWCLVILVMILFIVGGLFVASYFLVGTQIIRDTEFLNPEIEMIDGERRLYFENYIGHSGMFPAGAKIGRRGDKLTIRPIYCVSGAWPIYCRYDSKFVYVKDRDGSDPIYAIGYIVVPSSPETIIVEFQGGGIRLIEP